MELSSKKILFCFPYRNGPGGVNMLFLRLATYLQKQSYNVAIVDYPDGDMATNKADDLELIPYHDEVPVVLPKNSVIVFQSMTPWSIFPMLEIDSESNIFFIATLPANFYPVLPGFLRNKMYEGGWIAKVFWKTILLSEYSKSKAFLNLITGKKAHAILDSNIACNLENSLQVELKGCQYLPLFSSDETRNGYCITDKENDDGVIKLGWVGRLADFKISILNRVIIDAFNYANSKQQVIEFYVVGSGEFESCLMDLSSEYFLLNRVSYIKPSELNDFMLTLGMLFAMGTSALDGAKLGVPTVRLDYSYQEVPKWYRYKFFHEIQGFSLAERIGGKCFQNGVHDFNSLMSEWESNRTELSIKSYDFYQDNHSISNSARLFISYLNKSSLIWEDLENRGLLSSVFYGAWQKIKSAMK